MNEFQVNQFTTNQFAKRVGRSNDTVRRWRRDGTLVPTQTRQTKTVTVYLYTDEDVNKALRLIRKRETGIAS